MKADQKKLVTLLDGFYKVSSTNIKDDGGRVVYELRVKQKNSGFRKLSKKFVLLSARGEYKTFQEHANQYPTEVRDISRMSGRAKSAREMFRERYPTGQKNLMTQNVVRYGKVSPNIAYELSSGDKMFRDGEGGGQAFGVTVIARKPDGAMTSTELSHLFQNRENAEKYINTLKESSERFLMARAFNTDNSLKDYADFIEGYGKKGAKVEQVSPNVSVKTMTVESRPRRKRVGA